MFRCPECGNEIAENVVEVLRRGSRGMVSVSVAPMCANDEAHRGEYEMRRVTQPERPLDPPRREDLL